MNDSKTGSNFEVHESGNIGQTISDYNGTIIAWTTDAWVAQVISMLLNKNTHLLFRKETEYETDMDNSIRWRHVPFKRRIIG